MADNDKEPRYEKVEDLGESVTRMDANNAAPGAGARHSEDVEATEEPLTHQRVVSGAERTRSVPEAYRYEMDASEYRLPDPQQEVSDEELHRAIEGLQDAREREDREGKEAA